MAHCQVCAQAFRRSGAARKSARKWQQLHDLVEPFTGLHQKADVAGEPLKPYTEKAKSVGLLVIAMQLKL